MDKNTLRSIFLEKRNQLSSADLTEKNEMIAQNVLSFLDNKSIDTLHTFLPQKGKNEIDTWQIIRLIPTRFPDMRLVAPRVIPKTRLLEHFLLTEQTTLIDSPWQIPEPDPVTSFKIEPTALDAVLIPLLAFDYQGYRVGYGGGFYDRFLPLCKPGVLKIGLSFFEPLNERIDTDDFDIPLQYCITPKGIITI